MSSEDVDAVLWGKICLAFPSLVDKCQDASSCSRLEFRNICLVIKQNNLCDDLEDLLLRNIKNKLLSVDVPKFWSYFDPIGIDKSNTANNEQGFKLFIAAVTYLDKQVEEHSKILMKINSMRRICVYTKQLYGYDDVLESFGVILRAALHSQLPKDHDTITNHFYKYCFDTFSCKNANVSVGSKSSQCTTCEDECKCSDLESGQVCSRFEISQFAKINQILLRLGILEPLTGNVITNLIHKHIERYVEDTCTGCFDRSFFESLESWLEDVVIVWLSRIYEPHKYIEEQQTQDQPQVEQSQPQPDQPKTQTEQPQTPEPKQKTTVTKMDTSTPKEKVTKMETGSDDVVVDTAEPKYSIFEENKNRLMYLLYETYTRLRIDQLFNIIIEYPESGPAVDDLRQCLQKVNLRSSLTGKLQMALETRLLHPGVNTSDILTAYISAIRALKQLDPSGVLLETVTKPIRQYLRSRDDTIRCVVHSLTEEGPTDLAEELVSGSANVQNGEDADDIADWENWVPDPIDADPSSNWKNRRTSDIITMLVNVYGSKELFVNEYRTLLADRLLTNFTYQTEKELRYLELLKLRFGDSLLHCCEVMLKDIYDSKRINAHLHTDGNFQIANQPFPVTAMILSAQFWPTFKDETLQLPDVFKEHFDAYTKGFEAFKGNRTLNWKPHLGNVRIAIELNNGREIELNVSPIHAVIIYQFERKTEWTIDELSQELQVSATVLRRKIAYWQSQGFIKEMGSDRFYLVDSSSPSKHITTLPSSNPSRYADMVIPCDDEERESAMASAHDLREEELQVFWTYIVGMLTNLDGLPLERIHQMLKMFASQGPPSAMECSIQELRKFLDSKVHEHKLLFTGNFYKLPKT